MPEKLLSDLRQVEELKQSIKSSVKHGIISDADAASQILMLKQKEYQLKQKLINEVHVTNDGTPRKIEYRESKGLWSTLMPDKSKLYGKSREVLLDKLMAKYGLSVTDYSLHTVFLQAIEHKDRTEAVNPETLNHLRTSYARFIDDKMSGTDIRRITCDMLSEYTLDMLRKQQETDSQGVTHKVKKKAYLDYKCVLNVIFDYALDKDYITVNPLNKFKNKAFLKECDCSKAVSEEKIFSEDEIEAIKQKVRSYMTFRRYAGYFINGYAILLSIMTGMRAGELPSLKWSDIKDNHIHIHSQQLSYKRKGGREYYYADWTKDEKGISRGGRKFPLTGEIRELLNELKELQDQKGIVSEFVFSHENGEWIKKDAYTTCLGRLLTSMGFDITNNHAFRMSLNSNVLDAKLSLPVAKRAELLGHSVETNLKYYTYAAKDDMEDLVDLFDSKAVKHAKLLEVSPRSHPKLVFFQKNESPEPNKFKAFK
ncbi:MAG: tyrosine-type recombinase/integrase [Lachnospiraceae bacterium]|nr:tyrosine-type recombinase/integrase [Lachnospiraceae bacterium]